MAINLPRYQELGVRAAAGSPISTAGAEAEARSAGTLAANIDKMTTAAFSVAENAAKVEGLEYGVANAPTLEQLMRAQETGEAVNIGSPYTVFGAAQRQGALFTIQKNTEIEARQKLAQLEATAKAANMPIAEFQKQLQSVVDGYGSAVASVSHSTAASVRATLSTVGASYYSQYADYQLKQAKEREKVLTIGGIDQIVQGVDAIVKQGDTIIASEEGDVVVSTVEQKLTAERNRILRYAYSIGDADLAKTKLKELNERAAKAKIAMVAEWTQDESGTPTLTKYNQVMADKVSDPRLTRMWSSLSTEDKVKAQDEIRRQMKAKLELESSLDAAQERARKDAIGNNRIEFQKAFERGDSEGMRGALQRMEGLGDAEGREKYATVASERATLTERGLMLVLEDQLTRGLLTGERVLTLVAERRLSDTDARALIGKIEIASNRDVAESMDFVKRELGYPDRTLINPGAADRAAIQRVNKINNALILAKRQAELDGKPFNAFGFVQQQIEQSQKTTVSPAELNAAEAKVKGLVKMFGLPDSASLDQVEQALLAAQSKKVGDRGYFNPKLVPEQRAAIQLLRENGSR